MSANDPVHVRWASKYVEGGNAYGFSLHSSMAAKHCTRHGVVHDPDAKLVVYVGSPFFWAPYEDEDGRDVLDVLRSQGKRAILYMSWELEEFPEAIKKQIRRADGVICSSPFLKALVEKEIPGLPCELATLGVEPDKYEYVERQDPAFHGGGRFQFLYVGAANQRKGSDVIMHAWRAFTLSWVGMGMHVRCPIKPLLYLKVSRVDSDELPEDEQIKCVQSNPPVILDYRKLPMKSDPNVHGGMTLPKLYQQSHAFLLPSFGECPGLTALEAAATGLPVVMTPRHGLKDSFPPGTAVPLKYTWKMDTYMGFEGVRVPMASAMHLAELIPDIMEQYPRYLRIGKRGSDHVRKRFTWDECGRQVACALRSLRKKLLG